MQHIEAFHGYSHRLRPSIAYPTAHELGWPHRQVPSLAQLPQRIYSFRLNRGWVTATEDVHAADRKINGTLALMRFSPVPVIWQPADEQWRSKHTQTKGNKHDADEIDTAVRPQSVKVETSTVCHAIGEVKGRDNKGGTLLCGAESKEVATVKCHACRIAAARMKVMVRAPVQPLKNMAYTETTLVNAFSMLRPMESKGGAQEKPSPFSVPVEEDQQCDSREKPSSGSSLADPIVVADSSDSEFRSKDVTI